MEVIMRKIDELKPHPKNPRVHPDSALKKLVKSIQEYGFTNPVLVSKDDIVLAGHARLKASKKAGLSEVPVIKLDLDGDKADAYLIADNRLQEETNWDYEVLMELVDDLNKSNYDLEITGFDYKELEKIQEKLNKEDELKPEIEFTEELLEEHNYVVLYFDNKLDWQVAKEKFGIRSVSALDSKKGYERKGIGRVLKGSDVLGMLK